MKDHRTSPNLFWPVLLIGIGLLLYFSEMGMIEPIDVNILWRMWPVFLVLIGVNMLFGRQVRWMASFLSAILALAVVAFLYFSPVIMEQLPTPEMVTEIYTEPLEDAQQAEIKLDFDRGNLNVGLLADSDQLFDATVVHNEEVTFRSSGSTTREIDLELNDVGMPQIGDFLNEQAQVRADIGLTGEIPLTLKIDIGGGTANLLLEDVSLERLEADSGSGGFDVMLPPGDYPVKLSSGSGGISVTTAEGSLLDMKVEVGSGRIGLNLAEDSEGEVQLDSGSGDITVTVPEGAAVQFVGSTGSGSIQLPEGFERISRGTGLTGERGTWQTQGFEDADMQIVISFEIGSGSLRVEYP
ncbi:DUF4097 domain-containing protein [bacterium]|nr:DUF4097 domain-containing protein [bacterium]